MFNFFRRNKKNDIAETRKDWNALYEKTIDEAAKRGVPFAKYVKDLERSRKGISLEQSVGSFGARLREAMGKGVRIVQTSREGVAMDEAQSAESAGKFYAAMDERCGTKLVGRNSIGSGNADAEAMLTHFYQQNFIGWQACAMLKQHWIIDRACSVPPKDAMSNGYTLRIVGDPQWGVEGEGGKKTSGDGKKNAERLADIYRRSEQVYGVRSLCERASTLKKVFGWSLVVPIIKGANMEKPFNLDGVKRDSYEGLITIEPYWLTPEFDNASMQDPHSPRFYRPTFYYVAGYGRIHHSWTVRLDNSVLPDILKPMYYFGGIPLPQQIFERVYASERVSNEAPLIAMTKRLLVVDMYIDNYVANQAEGDDTLKALTYLRDNFAIMCKEPGTDISQIDTTLTGFDELLMSQWQLCCSIAEMPAVKLLKTQPRGFNSSGEFEEKDYRQVLMRLQHSDFEPILDLHHKLMIKSEGLGDIKLTVSFNPIDAPTDEQVAELTEKWSLTLSHLLTLGAIDIRESRQLLKTIPYSPFGFLEEAPDTSELIENVSNAAGEGEEPSAEELAKKNGGGEAAGISSLPSTLSKTNFTTAKAKKDGKGRFLPVNEDDPA